MLWTVKMPNQYTFKELEVSDLHKDATGFRPQAEFWNQWATANDSEKQKIWDNLIDLLNSDIL
jgi:hypothetical protein